MRIKPAALAPILALALLLGGPTRALAAEGDETPTLARVLLGRTPAYEPLVKYRFRGMEIALPVLVGGRVEGLSEYPVDSDGHLLSTDAGGFLLFRLAFSFNTRRAILPFNIGVDYEHDLITGPVGGSVNIEGKGMPNSAEIEQNVRKAIARVSLGYYLHLSGGLTTSQFGLGLVSNDGAHGWTPGSALFSDPHGGDRVARVLVATGPVTPAGVVAAFGHDWVRGDDVLLEGDTAHQYFGVLTIGAKKATSLGFYGVYRMQDAADGANIRVSVLDLYLRTRRELPRDLTLTVELESAIVVGSTSLAPSPEFPVKDVLQYGMDLRASLAAKRVGGVLDLFLATGDGNYDDSQQNAFKADPNFELGLLLFRHVMAGQSGRSAVTAADTSLVGYPAQDLDRLPTRGSATNAVALFPRAFYRPLGGLEVYGGPLFAFAAAAQADPLNSRLAGGSPRNALGVAPGDYLGTELDLGVRFQGLVGGTELMAGLEGGILFPGSAIAGDGTTIKNDPVVGGRLLLYYRF